MLGDVLTGFLLHSHDPKQNLFHDARPMRSPTLLLSLHLHMPMLLSRQHPRMSLSVVDVCQKNSKKSHRKAAYHSQEGSPLTEARLKLQLLTVSYDSRGLLQAPRTFNMYSGYLHFTHAAQAVWTLSRRALLRKLAKAWFVMLLTRIRCHIPTSLLAPPSPWTRRHHHSVQ